MAIWHASLVEVLWTVIGLVGVVIGRRNLKASRDDIKAIDKLNGKTLAAHRTMKIIAYGHYRNDAFRLAKHATITMVGVVSMILPPAKHAPPVTPTGVIITGGLFTISILLVLASALDNRQREALEEIGD